MSSAKLYVSTDVVERLSRPSNAAPAPASSGSLDDTHAQYFDSSVQQERPVMDMASFMGSVQPSRHSAGGGGGGSGMYDTPGKGGNPNNLSSSTTEAKAKRDAKFEMFLARQQANLKKKEDSIKQVRGSGMRFPLLLLFL